MKDITERANREFRVQLILQEVDRATGEVLLADREVGIALADLTAHDRELAHAATLGCIKYIMDLDRAHALLHRFLAARDTKGDVA